MRVDPDFAPPASQPPRREASPPRHPQDSARPARPQQGRPTAKEKDPNDYDDGAWM